MGSPFPFCLKAAESASADAVSVLDKGGQMQKDQKKDQKVAGLKQTPLFDKG